MIKLAKSIILIINYKTIIVTILAVFSTWLCGYYGITANLPLTIIGIAIVFPVVFSIDSAYKRRERVLAILGDLKGHLFSLFLASRDWIQAENKEFAVSFKSDLIHVLKSLMHFCTSQNEEDLDKYEEQLYNSVSKLSNTAQQFREMGMYLGEVSRINQYISKISIDIEGIKAIRRYPTPVTLRSYSKVFIFSFPILYGPYFRFIANEISHGMEYMMPVIFSFILVSLDNIQVHLENPFDQVGEDDVHFNVDEFEQSMKI